MLRLNEYFKNREVRRNRYLTLHYEAIVYQDKYYVVSRAIYPNFFLVTGYFIEMFLTYLCALFTSTESSAFSYS